MEVLRRGGGVDELHVVLGGEHEEALDAGRRVLGALTLVPVRQQQHQPVALTPLVLGGDDVLVDDDLGAVDEIAELGLPHDQRIGVGVRVAVLETHRRVLGEQRVVDPEVGLGSLEIGERDPRVAGLVVEQRRMALAERAAPGVLPGEPCGVPLEDQ